MEITIVTAFFDIGRSNWAGFMNGRALPNFLKRDNEEYLSHFSRLSRLNNDIIVHTTSQFADQVMAIREAAGYGSRTKVVCHDDIFDNNQETIVRILDVMKNPNFITSVVNPQMPEYWNPFYILINYWKSYFVTQSIEAGDIKTEQAAWIDFGYCRDDSRFEPGSTWSHDFGDKINLFNIRPLDPARPIEDIVRTGEVYIQGCHVVSNLKGWHDLRAMMETALEYLLSHDMIDDDQTMLLMSYRSNPEKFQINFVDETKDGWFVIFKDFR